MCQLVAKLFSFKEPCSRGFPPNKKKGEQRRQLPSWLSLKLVELPQKPGDKRKQPTLGPWEKLDRHLFLLAEFKGIGTLNPPQKREQRGSNPLGWAKAKLSDYI